MLSSFPTNDRGAATNETSSGSAAAVRIARGQDIVTVIERFDVPAEKQSEAVGRATDHVALAWKEEPGFVAAVLLRGRGGGGIVAYSQWKRPVDGSLPVSVPGAWSLEAALPGFTMLDSRAYTVEFTDSADLAAELSLDRTPFAHFGIFGVARENQDRLLDLARENAPRSLQHAPGLISINFHRSTDGSQVINLGTWNTFDHIDQLLQQPGFKEDSLYWDGVADFQPDFFDVVLVEAGEHP